MKLLSAGQASRPRSPLRAELQRPHTGLNGSHRPWREPQQVSRARNETRPQGVAEPRVHGAVRGAFLQACTLVLWTRGVSRRIEAVGGEVRKMSNAANEMLPDNAS